ncbi:hypothetical protein [Collinsella sp. An2]|uniref:lipopolysaccharide biosynthesis protein n=1 Tax=Collinsella sp. An2 TaxID=1965585 RepID=UPI000B3732FC|nr:hypothetical protein [Collinsella sp. An2]OUP10060.1 hypothetical protein B5F33_03105 [Collinsella sp. An2]
MNTKTPQSVAPLSLRANTIWNALGCLFYLGCQWLTSVLVVRLSSGYENSGALAFAMANGIIFASIGLYKIRTFQVSDLSGEFSHGDYVGFRLVTIVLGLIWSAIYLPLACSSNAEFLVASIAYLLFKSDEVFSDVLYGIDQVGERMDFIGKSQLMRGVASLVGFSIPLAVLDNLVAGILGMAAACIAVTVFYDIPHARLFGDITPSFNVSHIKKLGKSCLLAMIASLCANGIVSIVRQYFGVTYGSEALGIYASVATPAVLIQVSATYLYSPLIGTLAKKLHQEGRNSFAKEFFRILFLILIVILVFIAILSAVGDWGLQLVFGTSIAPYTYLFPFVLLATGSVGILFYTNDVLVILRKTPAMLACNLLALGAALALAIPLTTNLGMNGINFSVIGGCAIAVALSMVFILRHQRSATDARN